MSKSQNYKAVRKLAEDIPGAFAYIFDSSPDGRFIYKSGERKAFEEQLLNLNNQKNLSDRLNLSKKNFMKLSVENPCFLILLKKIATDLFFIMCVENQPKTVTLAENVMNSTFKSKTS